MRISGLGLGLERLGLAKVDSLGPSVLSQILERVVALRHERLGFRVRFWILSRAEATLKVGEGPVEVAIGFVLEFRMLECVS